jgi:predicted nucleic acid-binding protein
MPLVLDVSATLSWLIDDERDALSAAMAESIVERGAIVPTLWRLELRNALLAAERRGRLTSTQIDQLLRDVRQLPIEFVDALDAADESELALARRYGLSVYDAAYLAVAVRTASTLMTRDALLESAADDLHLRWRPSAS